MLYKNYYENLPNGWIVSNYSNVLLEAYGGGTPIKTQPSFWGGNISWCSVKDLSENIVISETKDFITKEGLNNSSSNIVKKGNLILCTRMAVGKIRIAGKDMAINHDLKGLVLSTIISKDFFIYQVLATKFNCTGTTVKGLKFKDFLQHAFFLPPLNEQNKISSKIQKILTIID